MKSFVVCVCCVCVCCVCVCVCVCVSVCVVCVCVCCMMDVDEISFCSRKSRWSDRQRTFFLNMVKSSNLDSDIFFPKKCTTRKRKLSTYLDSSRQAGSESGLNFSI